MKKMSKYEKVEKKYEKKRGKKKERDFSKWNFLKTFSGQLESCTDYIGLVLVDEFMVKHLM